MTKRSAERTQFLADIIITAVEGGIGYWAAVRGYKAPDDNPAGTRALLRVHDEDDGYCAWTDVAKSLVYPRAMSVDGRWAVLGVNTIAHGISLIRKGECSLDPAIRKNILGASAVNEAGDIDSSDADIIVQLGILGDIVFG